MKFVFADEETGQVVVRDLSEEQVEMIRGFYDLPEDDA